MAKNSNAKKFAIGTVSAAAVGYVAGILTAPKSGKETRQDIKDTATKGIAEAEKQLKKLHTELNSLIDEARLRSANMNAKARKEVDAALEKAGVAKEKARAVLSAIHEGDAEDEDLNKAVTEVNKAIKHLKTYLSK
ncbi:MAG TPA: YtxH domain-containing protein [Chroococcales cyanobacterium]